MKVKTWFDLIRIGSWRFYETRYQHHFFGRIVHPAGLQPDMGTGGVNKADTAFRMTMQVRNKIVEAYQEVMRMQV